MEFEISVRELSEKLRNDGRDVLLLDCREAPELELARIAGATHIPMGDIPMNLHQLDDEREIVVMCHHGIRSASVAVWLLEEGGFERVRSLRGGIDAWSREVDPTVPRY